MTKYEAYWLDVYRIVLPEGAKPVALRRYWKPGDIAVGDPPTVIIREDGTKLYVYWDEEYTLYYSGMPWLEQGGAWYTEIQRRHAYRPATR